MDKTSETRAAGIFFTRTLLGIIFLMQGYGKIFTFTVAKVYGQVSSTHQNKKKKKCRPLHVLEETGVKNKYTKAIRLRRAHIMKTREKCAD